MRRLHASLTEASLPSCVIVCVDAPVGREPHSASITDCGHVLINCAVFQKIKIDGALMPDGWRGSAGYTLLGR